MKSTLTEEDETKLNNWDRRPVLPVSSYGASKGSHQKQLKDQPLWEGLAVPTYAWDRTILKKINTARRMQVNLGRTTTYGKPQEKNNQTKLDPLTLFSKIMPERPGEQGRAVKLWQRQRQSAREGAGKLYLKPWGIPVSWRDAPSTLVKCDRKEIAVFLWGLRQEKQRPHSTFLLWVAPSQGVYILGAIAGRWKYLIHKNRSALELIYLRPGSNS